MAKKLTFLLLVAIFSIPLLIMSTLPSLYIIIFFSLIAGCATWYLFGRLTPFFTSIYISLFHGLIGKFSSEKEISIVENKNYRKYDFWNVFYRSLSDSFFPTVISFTAIGYMLRNSGSPNNPRVFLILLFAPVIVSFIIPIRILRDSRLFYLDRDKKEIISVCRDIFIRLKSVGGLLALGLFLLTLYTISDNLNEAVNNLIVYFSFIYPTITITSYIYYDRWHRGFIELTNYVGESRDIREYVLGLFKE